MPRSVLIAGCGFIGLPLERDFVAVGWLTHAVTASEKAASKLQSENFRVESLNIADEAEVRQLVHLTFDTVIHCASSGYGGAEAYQSVYFRGAKNLLTHL